MFTGIVTAVGTIAALESREDAVRLHVRTGKLDLSDVALGDSIAVNGVCLTAVELPGDGFWADASRETLARTTLGMSDQGARVNLEKALTPSTRLGGHLVSGHVDGIGEVMARRDEEGFAFFQVQAPPSLARYIAEKGSICVDGVSLTVNSVEGARFDLYIVPHTLQETNIDGYRVGTKVNLEVDIIARYLERLLLGERAAEPDRGGVTRDLLARAGFLGGKD
jgi:riboflavin synthase